MTPFDVLSLAAGVVGVVAGAVFFALWRIEARRHRNTVAAVRTVAKRIERITPEYRSGAPVTERLPGQTRVLPLRPSPSVIDPMRPIRRGY